MEKDTPLCWASTDPGARCKLNDMSRPVGQVADPASETSVDYLVVGIDTMSPDIVEVDKGTPGGHRTLQEAKNRVMRVLRERIAEGMASLDRVRAIGVKIERLL